MKLTEDLKKLLILLPAIQLLHALIVHSNSRIMVCTSNPSHSSPKVDSHLYHQTTSNTLSLESIHTAPAIPNDLKSTQIRSLIPAPFNTAPAVPDFISSSSGMIVLQAVMRCINNWTLHPALKAVKGIQTKISGKYNENIVSVEFLTQKLC